MTFEHINEKFRHIANLPNDERIKFLHQPRWLDYPRAKGILNKLNELMDRTVKTRADNLLLSGESNNGKTTIIRHFQSQIKNQPKGVELEDKLSIPVIIAEAPPTPSEKGLYVSILEQLCVPYKTSSTAEKLRYQVIHMLRQCGTQLLMIDEIHNLLTGTPNKQREAMNVIKYLCNELAISIVGVGTPQAVQVLHTDPQHASRFDVVTLPKWKLNTEFQKLLASFESILPLREPSRLFEREKVKQIHYISDGNLGNVQRLLVECVIEAIRSGSETIDLDLIKSKSWVRPTKGIREVVF